MNPGDFHPELEEEQRMLLGTVAEFAADVVAPAAEAIDAEGEIPAEVLEQLAELGMLVIPVDEDHGGAGFDNVSYMLTLVELAQASPSVALHVHTQTALFLEPLGRFGGETAAEVFAAVAGGEASGAWGGSDVADCDAASVQTTVTGDGDTVTVSGTKRWVAAAPSAGHALVLGREGDGLSAALVDLGGAGVTRGARIDRMGLRGVAFADLTFDGAQAIRVGAAGDGEKILAHVRDHALVGAAAIGCGIMRGVGALAANYAVERRQFGRSLGAFEAIQERLSAIEAGRMTSLNMIVSAARMLDAGKPVTPLAEVTKLAAGRDAMAAADHALQIYGGYGYSREYPVERFYRDARWVAIAHGGQDALTRAVGQRIQPAL